LRIRDLAWITAFSEIASSRATSAAGRPPRANRLKADPLWLDSSLDDRIQERIPELIAQVAEVEFVLAVQL
jgi:hypothetical protein